MINLDDVAEQINEWDRELRDWCDGGGRERFLRSLQKQLTKKNLVRLGYHGLLDSVQGQLYVQMGRLMRIQAAVATIANCAQAAVAWIADRGKIGGEQLARIGNLSEAVG